MKHLFIYGFVILAICCCGKKQENFYFKDGTFKIVQFTDLHWEHGSPGCDSTEQTITSILGTERPDLAVLTGDVVTEKPGLEGWNDIVKIFETAKIPFVVTLGNHDAEVMPKDSIYDILTKSPVYAGRKGDEKLFGKGNCDIPIMSSDKKRVGFVLYFLDSNDYRENKDLGEYDWIHHDQIEWYRKTSDSYTASNKGKPVPSMAFFHIPLLEWNNIVGDPVTIGNKKEIPVASPRINSGLFGSFADKGDMLGAFVGHDHDNDYVGMEFGIALGFGRVTGKDAYGDLKRGGRVIVLYENMRKFDTYAVTPQEKEPVFYYPSGINSLEEQNMNFMRGENVSPVKNGVNYSYFEGKIKRIDDEKNILKMNHVENGILNGFDISGAKSTDHFAYIFEAFLYIDKKNVYKFYTFSDDGSLLYIDGTLVVDNDGGHSMRRREGKVALEEGYHRLKLLYFENYMGESLEVGYSSKDMFERKIPGEVLFTVK